MRLETRYIDIEKSISIIDRNFHIDLYRPYRWFTATLPVVDWCQTGDKSLMLTKIYDTNAVIRPQRIAMLRFMTPYWIKRPQWVKTPRILRIDPKLTLLQSLMIVSPISTRFDDEFQIVHQGDLQFFFFRHLRCLGCESSCWLLLQLWMLQGYPSNPTYWITNTSGLPSNV